MRLQLLILFILIELHAKEGAKFDLLNLVNDIANTSQEIKDSLKMNLPGKFLLRIESNDISVSASCLIGYWLAGDDGMITELTWWRSKDPLLRELAASLILLGQTENTSNVANLDPARFAETEKKNRISELEYVHKNSKAIGSIMYKIIVKTYDDNPNKYKNVLKQRFESFKNEPNSGNQ